MKCLLDAVGEGFGGRGRDDAPHQDRAVAENARANDAGRQVGGLNRRQPLGGERIGVRFGVGGSVAGLLERSYAGDVAKREYPALPVAIAGLAVGGHQTCDLGADLLDRTIVPCLFADRDPAALRRARIAPPGPLSPFEDHSFCLCSSARSDG